MMLSKRTFSLALLSTALAVPCTPEDRSGCVLGQLPDGQATVASACLHHLTSGTLPASLSSLCHSTKASSVTSSVLSLSAVSSRAATSSTAVVTARTTPSSIQGPPPPAVPSTSAAAVPSTRLSTSDTSPSVIVSSSATVLAISQVQPPPQATSPDQNGSHQEVNVVIVADPSRGTRVNAGEEKPEDTKEAEKQRPDNAEATDEQESKDSEVMEVEKPVPTATTINGRLYAIVYPKSTVIDGATYVLPETFTTLPASKPAPEPQSASLPPSQPGATPTTAIAVHTVSNTGLKTEIVVVTETTSSPYSTTMAPKYAITTVFVPPPAQTETPTTTSTTTRYVCYEVGTIKMWECKPNDLNCICPPHMDNLRCREFKLNCAMERKY